MEDYLKGNDHHWQVRHVGSGSNRYISSHVESYVFRTYGRILKYELGLTGKNGERMLDFGCGSGAVLSFFDREGFDVYGVDISPDAIESCKQGMPHISSHFSVVEARPKLGDIFFEGDYDLVTAIESLYYYSPEDLRTRLLSLKAQMKPGGILFATMKGSKCWYYDHSVPCDNGMRRVHIDTPRLKITDYYMTFVESRDDLIEKFSMFEKLHVGFCDDCYREDEGSDFSWLFVGRA